MRESKFTSVTINPKNCYAGNYGNDYYMNYKYSFSTGISNLKYYVCSSAKAYEGQINGALSSWKYATRNNSSKAKATFTKVTNINDAAIVFSAVSSFSGLPAGTKGYVQYFNRTKQF